MIDGNVWLQMVIDGIAAICTVVVLFLQIGIVVVVVVAAGGICTTVGAQLGNGILRLMRTG